MQLENCIVHSTYV
uniref:Uncharacterized protein n=1 Tax=Arundo donax TaxID=35708 RepID=A0A0A9HAB5_ARUDO